MDFKVAVVEALDRIIEGGAIQQAIEQALIKTIKETVDSEMRPYSEFGKRLQEAVKSSLKVYGDLELPEYNDAILKIVRAQVDGYTRSTIQKQIAANMEHLLEPAPAEITLSALVEKFIKSVREDHSIGGCMCHGDMAEIGFEVEERDYGFKYIKLTKEPERSSIPSRTRERPDIELCVTKEGEVFSLNFRSKDVETAMFAGPFYGFERAVFQMRAAKTKIVFDVEPSEIETTWYAEA